MKRTFCGALLATVLCAGLAGGGAGGGAGAGQARSAEAAVTPAITPAITPAVAPPNDFVYQLQNVDLGAMGRTRFDYVIMDYSRDGSDARRYTAPEINALKTSPGGPKTVLSYMSIGEAEDYRWYWQRSWDADRNGKPDPGAPSWLGPSNPEWRGNYKVRYWDPAWQQIVHDYLDRAIAADYDGVYLDIVDGYEFWKTGGPGSPDRPSAEADMVAFVKSIGDYARANGGGPDFQVFVQNAEELSQNPGYVDSVSGIGKEDLFYNGNRRQPKSEVRYSSKQLDRFKAAGKPVLVTDYVTRRETIDPFYKRAKARGYVPYATRRNLDVLTINRGHAPD